MKAIVCRQYGSPDVLHLEEVQKPTAAGFVEVKAVADSRGARPFVGAAPKTVAVDIHSAGVRIELSGPRHPVTGTINYMLNQWKPLTVFLTDGAIAIHNNVA